MVHVVISFQFEIEITFQYESAREVDHTSRRDEAIVLSRAFFSKILRPLDDMSRYRCVSTCALPSQTTLNITRRDK